MMVGKSRGFSGGRSGCGKSGNSDRLPDDRARRPLSVIPPCASPTNIDEPSAGSFLNYLNHDCERVFPANHCGLCQALREGRVAAVQETWDMGEGQLHSTFTSLGGVVPKPCVRLMGSRHVAIHLGYNRVLHRVGYHIHPQRRGHCAGHVRRGPEA